MNLKDNKVIKTHFSLNTDEKINGIIQPPTSIFTYTHTSTTYWTMPKITLLYESI